MPDIPTVVGAADCRDCAGQWPIPRARSINGELLMSTCPCCNGRSFDPEDDSNLLCGTCWLFADHPDHDHDDPEEGN